jgi:hypothetical protein
VRAVRMIALAVHACVANLKNSSISTANIGSVKFLATRKERYSLFNKGREKKEEKIYSFIK